MIGVAGDASRDVASNATASALTAMVLLLAASAVGAWWLGRRRAFAHGSLAWFAALGSIAGCISLTLARSGAPEGFRPGSVFAWTGSGWDRLIDGDLLGSSQFLLNVALFVPAGLAWTWLTRRPARTLAGIAALSMLIESVQAVGGLGAADITDVVANSIGAALGVVTATVAMFGFGRSDTTSTRPPVEPRRRPGVAAGVVVTVVAVLLALLAGADRRQAGIHDELVDAFAGTSFDDIAAVLLRDPDDPERFAPGARFTDSEQIFSAISVRADGFRYTDDQIELRWPALFVGFRRCVYVIWTPADVQLRDLSGPACTKFIG